MTGFLKELLLDMQELCAETDSMKGDIKQKNDILLDLILALETEKAELEKSIMEYEQARHVLILSDVGNDEGSR